MRRSIFLPLLLMFGCSDSNSWSEEQARKEILELHHAQRTFHFEGDSVAFVNQLSDQFISVNRGVISSPDKSSMISRYHRYFSSVDFQAWDDQAEPIIRFSADGTMAYAIVDKLVVVSYPAEDDSLITDSTHFAWTTIYRHTPEGWTIDCVTSTDR